MTNLHYLTVTTWKDVAPTVWPWRNFSPYEMMCKGTGRVHVCVELMDKLQALRDRIGKPIVVLSGFRSPEHNAIIGGAPQSMHLQGEAADISMANHNPISFFATAKELGFLGFGFYPFGAGNFMHLDLGHPAILNTDGSRRYRTWGNPAPWGINPY